MQVHLQLSISHFWPFNVAKCYQTNSPDNGLNIRKNKQKKRRLTNWPNIATKFAKQGTLRSLLLSNWSSWHRAASATQWAEFFCNDQSSTSPGENCARLPAGLRPHRHLWSHCQSTWSAQKRTVGQQGRQSVAAPLASDFCKSICNCLFHMFGLSMLPNVIKQTAVTMALTFEKTNKKKERLTNWPNIATKFAKQGTLRSLLLSNWSSWHRAASATQVMESSCTFGDSGTPGCSASDVAGLRHMRLLGSGLHRLD